jgi:altronate dehydratase
MDGCGEHTVETLGDELYDMIVRQASGLEPTQGETHGHAGTCDLFDLFEPFSSVKGIEYQVCDLLP